MNRAENYKKLKEIEKTTYELIEKAIRDTYIDTSGITYVASSMIQVVGEQTGLSIKIGDREFVLLGEKHNPYMEISFGLSEVVLNTDNYPNKKLRPIQKPNIIYKNGSYSLNGVIGEGDKIGSAFIEFLMEQVT